MQPPIQLHAGLSDCTCRECNRRRYQRRQDADELRIYPESAYDAQDWRCVEWLERGYRTGVFESLPVRGPVVKTELAGAHQAAFWPDLVREEAA